jgi:hypothetical protein
MRVGYQNGPGRENLKLNTESRIRLAAIVLGTAFVFAFALVRGARAENEPKHQVTDWSHRHVAFSGPKTLLQSLILARNPRYVQQSVRRYAERRIDWRDWRGHNTPEDLLQGDWNVYMGNVGTVGAGNYPAKYSFSATSANCANATQPDFVVYNTSLAGAATALAAFDTGTFSAAAALGSTVTITNPNTSKTLVLTAGTTNTSSGTGTGTFIAGASATASATGLFNSIQTSGNGSFVGVSAANPSAGAVTITAASAGTGGNSITVTASSAPASHLTLTFANLVDGAAGTPTIVAFDNLYSGCSGTVPSTYWAYNTGTTDSVVTSPALSGDGKQVVFIQSASGGAASLVILRWAANSGSTSSPATPTAATPTAYYNGGAGCTAPCMTTIAFANGASDTQSSPFYDFSPGSDTLYVGDSTGFIHKFNPVFNGIPAEVTTTWPVQMAVVPLSSPIYDSGSGKVFVTTSRVTSAKSGARLAAVCATATCGTIGTTTPSNVLGPTETPAAACKGTGASGDTVDLRVDAPILDPTNGTLYAFVGNDGNGNSAVYQFSTGYALHTCGTEVTLGTGSTTGVPLYAGSFDNAYYTGGAGHLYACGNAGGNPTLYQIAAPSTGILTAGSGTAGPVLTTAATTCGPVIEVYNPNAIGGAKDWIVTNVQASAQTASPISCPTNTGCIMSFDVTTSAGFSGSTTTIGHTAVAGGASGVVVDNTVGAGTLAGASQFYFTPLATGNCTSAAGQGIGGCAIQASQSALN